MASAVVFYYVIQKEHAMAEYEREDFPIIARNEDYVIRHIPYSSEWMVGKIQGEVFGDNNAARILLATAVLNNVMEVASGHRDTSTCTDGRLRIGLEDGSEVVPISEQLVGATAVSGFVIAEALGGRFYGERVNAPVDERLRYSFDFMQANGERVKTHVPCGAAVGLVAVQANLPQFAEFPSYRRRLSAIMPENVYDERAFREDVAATQQRLDRNVYEGYSDQLVTDHVVALGGKVMVERYLDDGVGEHGHVEAAVVVEDESMPGVAINQNELARATRRQVFGLNNSKADSLVRMFSNNGDDEEAYVRAWHAVSNFGSAGHGTLGNNLETWLASRS
jgi:hypothetical protein